MGREGRGVASRTGGRLLALSRAPLRRLLPQHTGTGGRLVLHPHPVQGLLSDKSARTASTTLISVSP